MENEEQETLKSKTQVKKEMTELQNVGIALTRLSREKLAAIPMSDTLRETLEAASSIKTHSATRRYRQYIGKLMRKEDSEKILQAYHSMLAEEKNAARRFQQLENWRQELVAGDKDKLAAFFQAYPQADRQKLNQLIRNTQKEISQGKKTAGSAKKLFQFLRELS